MRKIIYLVFAVALSGIMFSACEAEPTAPSTRQPSVVTEQSLPEPTGYVVDTSNILSDETENSLKVRLQAFDQTAQIAVVTVPTTGSLDEAQYAIKLAEKWKVGHQGADNGIIFLIVTDDRKLRIEVGRGLEDELTDGEAGAILDELVVPELKAGNWEKGIISGTEGIITEVSHE